MQEGTKLCPKCYKVIPKDAVLCPYCGYRFPTQQHQEEIKTTCPRCGREVPSDANLCPYCGYNLGGKPIYLVKKVKEKKYDYFY